MEAFRLADEMGADGVELDVRLAPEGRLVVAHDPLPDDPDRVATLPDLVPILAACGERMLINVEIKNETEDPSIVAPTIEALHTSGIDLRRVLISSFSWPTIDACRRIDPEIPTAALCGDVEEADLDRLARAGHLALHPHALLVTAERVEQCHVRGLMVTAWTCNDPDMLRTLAAMGVDGVCTDVPDVALEALGRAGPALNPRWAPAR